MDGNKKEDGASRTVSIPAIMISTRQDAIDERNIVTLDISRTFLQTDQPDDDKVIIRFTETTLE